MSFNAIAEERMSGILWYFQDRFDVAQDPIWNTLKTRLYYAALTRRGGESLSRGRFVVTIYGI